MSDVFGVIEFQLGNLADVFRDAQVSMIANDIALSDPVRHFFEVSRLVLDLAAVQPTGNPLLMVGSLRPKWEERERTPGELLIADLLDASDGMLELSNSFGAKPGKSAFVVLELSELGLASRWGTEFCDMLCVLSHIPGLQPVAQAPVSCNPIQSAYSDGIRLAVEIRKYFGQDTPLPQSATRLLIDSSGRSDRQGAAAYERMAGQFGGCGSALLQRQKAGDARASDLLERLLAFLELTATLLKDESHLAVMRETRMMQRLKADAACFAQ